MYSVDTTAFLTRREYQLNRRKGELEREKDHINALIEHLKIEVGNIIHNEYMADLYRNDYMGRLGAFFKHEKGSFTVEQIDKLNQIDDRYNMLKYYREYKLNKIAEVKDALYSRMKEAISRNRRDKRKVLRHLRKTALRDQNVISNFESTLTRTLGIQTDELTTDLFTVKVYFEEIAQDIINNGFLYNGEKYIFFSASAGQIRTKRTVFMKESVFEEHYNTLMCGLTLDDINARGGVNVNKFLAYSSLISSATDEWTDFDIDKSIVIPDFQNVVHGVVDHVNDATYNIFRKEMDIELEQTDGCGMMLPSVSDHNFMVRLPWIKGLLAVFDFKRFIEENGCSPVIKDIYGEEHDVIAEDIQVIFTKSQTKMWKYYGSWLEYKENFKKYGCQAGKCKEEEPEIPSANLNYQMLQTLTNITDRELKIIAHPAVSKLENSTKSIVGMLEIMRATPDNQKKTPLEKSLLLYPELLTDTYCKERITQIKQKLVGDYRAGRLPVRGKYTFVVPDLYAACQYWFMGDPDPEGLLEDGEVCCHLYPNSRKLDCLRAPHLYREHAVRQNVIDNMTADWFSTNAVYISCHDFISRILQCDWDGDTLLVVADPTFIKVAERNMQGVVPLYYEMKKAEPNIIDRSNFFDGMKLAWAGGKIGAPSNNITKIWNEEDIGEEEEKAVKLLCLEVNFTIDYAKTLYKPSRPDWASEFLGKYTQKKVPFFFQEAKGKTYDQVAPLNNSLVNKLRSLIKNVRISYHNLAEVDYKLLMSDQTVDYIDEDLCKVYIELARQYHFKLANAVDIEDDNFSYIIAKCRNQLLEFGTEEEVTDQLTQYLFQRRSKKSLFWACFGDTLYNNLERNLDKHSRWCRSCGKRFTPRNNRQRFCDDCHDKHKREQTRLRVRRMREKNKKM